MSRSGAVVSAVDGWLRSHHGVISRSVLLELGLTSGEVAAFVRSERLIALHRGIYRSPAHPETRHQLMVAACLLSPTAWVASTTACQEWRLRGMADDRVRVLLPHAVRFSLDGVVVHRSRRIDPVDVTGPRPDGIRLTSPPRSLHDAAALLGPEAIASAIEQVLAERRCTYGTLLATSRRLSHPRIVGTTPFDAVLLSRPAWRRAARSELERELGQALLRRGLPQPIVNMPFLLTDGTHIQIDFAWPQWKVALEVDHPFWHDGVVESRRDKRRDRQLAAMGWLPQRVTKADIEEELDRTLDEVAAVLSDRGWERDAAA